MTNSNNPFGLRAVDHNTGAPYNGRANVYYAPASYATNIFVGDLVIRDGSGNSSIITTGSGSYSVGSLPTVQRFTAGATNQTTGVVVGVDADPNNLENVYGVASTDRVLKVVDAQDALFEVQVNDFITVDQIGLNAVFDDSTPGSTITGLSGIQLDMTGTPPASDATYQATILRGIDRVDNVFIEQYSKVLIRLNLPTESTRLAGI